jgi:hypothetical protein
MEYCKCVQNEMVKQNFEIISNKSNIYGTYQHKFNKNGIKNSNTVRSIELEIVW